LLSERKRKRTIQDTDSGPNCQRTLPESIPAPGPNGKTKSIPAPQERMNESLSQPHSPLPSVSLPEPDCLPLSTIDSEVDTPQSTNDPDAIATKADDARVPTRLWEEQLELPPHGDYLRRHSLTTRSKAYKMLQTVMLQWWKRRVTKSFLDWLRAGPHVSPSDLVVRKGNH
jgi:hypothetical protein